MPLKTSATTVRMPAESPPANALNDTPILFEITVLEINGRMSGSSAMYPVPSRARVMPSSARSSIPDGMNEDADAGSRTTPTQATTAGT